MRRSGAPPLKACSSRYGTGNDQAVQKTLNTKLRILKLQDLGALFRKLPPSSPPNGHPGEPANLSLFEQLSVADQVLVFKTIEEAMEAPSPRSQANFGAVVQAFTSLNTTLNAARSGQLSGITCKTCSRRSVMPAANSPPGSMPSVMNRFSTSTSSALARWNGSSNPPCCPCPCRPQCLPAAIQAQQLHQLGADGQAFLEPVINKQADNRLLERLQKLSLSSQCLLLDTFAGNFSRAEHSEQCGFFTLVEAYESYENLCSTTSSGRINESFFEHLEQRVAAAGGLIEPGVHAQGQRSINAFREETFTALRNRCLPEVAAAALDAANTLAPFG